MIKKRKINVWNLLTYFILLLGVYVMLVPFF